tara:strand:+ start:1189 stop:1944 length:756 start_codon:yes stop_codon:yes gene_type:complete
MNDLYGNALARVYDKMYQVFIDYEAEYQFYAKYCNAFGVTSVLEIACGSGNLAAAFSKNFIDYLGLNSSEHMLQLARQKFSSGRFLHADMRDFVLPKKYNAALITGRSTSYLLTDRDVNDTVACVYRALSGNGIFIFDCIDADRFIPYLEQNPSVIHDAIIDGVRYSRESQWSHRLTQNIDTVDWSANYYSDQGGGKRLLGQDSVVFRIFCEAEVRAMLGSNGFEVLEVLERKTYAFDTFVIVAKKGQKKT